MAVRHRSGLASFGHRLWPRCLLCFPTHAHQHWPVCQYHSAPRLQVTRVWQVWKPGEGGKEQRKEANMMRSKSFTCCSVWGKHACLVVMLSSAQHHAAHHYLLRLLKKKQLLFTVHNAAFIYGPHNGASSFTHVLIVSVRMRKGCSLEKRGWAHPWIMPTVTLVLCLLL